MEQYDYCKSEIVYFIENNAAMVLEIIRYAYGVNSETCYSLKYDKYSDGYFSVYAVNGERFINFLAKSGNKTTEACLFIDNELSIFDQYKSILRYEFIISFDTQFQEVSAEILCGTATRITNLLKINLLDSKISIEYLFKDVSFEKHYLKASSISSSQMKKEISVIFDSFINHRNLFKTYSITDIVNAHDNQELLKDMVQVSDMAMI